MVGRVNTIRGTAFRMAMITSVSQKEIEQNFSPFHILKGKGIHTEFRMAKASS